MKRQHPTDPNLFWCPKCQMYKTREEFYKSSSKKDGIAPYCRICASRLPRNPDVERKKQRKWIDENKERKARHRKDWCINNPKQVKVKQRRQSERARRELRDRYIKEKLKRQGICEFSNNLIHAKRQQIKWLREITAGKEELKNGNSRIGSSEHHQST